MAAFSAPSVVLRPFIGQLVDSWSRRGVHLLGTACLGLITLLYLVPHLATVLVARVIHGTGWAAFNTGGGTTVAELAPASRRGEAAGIYNLMPGLANMAMPTLGLLLLKAGGFGAPLVAAALLGGTAALVLKLGPFLPDRSPSPRRGMRSWDAILERSAILPMGLDTLFTLTTTLFWVYPPLFARAHGIPLTDLATYYLLLGVALVTARLVVGRLIDRVARSTALLAGAAVTSVALGVASVADTALVLALAGVFHSFGSALITPAAMAVAIDGSSADRRGAAIATWSLGYQVGIGVGAVLWGTVIDRLGFPAPYLLALVSQALLIGLVVWRRDDLGAAIHGRQPPAA